MKAIIHIGTEKTGSTSIQEYLYQNRKILLKQKVAILKSAGKKNDRKLPAFCMDESRVDFYTTSQNIDLPKQRRAWRLKLKSDIQRELNKLKSKADRIIISSEHFHSRLESVEEVARLRNLLEPFCSDIQVIVYLRRQDKLAVSLFSTLCRGVWSSPNILPKEIKSGDTYYNYNRLIEKWTTVFGDGSVDIRSFDKLVEKKTSLIDDFILISGIKRTPYMSIPKRLNEKLSKEATDALIWYNKTYPNQSAYQLAFKQYLFLTLREQCKGKQALPNREDAIEFYSVFSESNSLLEAKYLGKESLFDNDFDHYPTSSVEDQNTDEIKNIIIKSSMEFTKNFILLPRRKSFLSWYYWYLKLPKYLKPYFDR